MLLVDLMFNRQAVSIPPEPPLNMVTLHGPIPGDDVLDGRSEQVAIVRKSSGERGTIVEGIQRTALRELNLSHRKKRR